ncbi:MAG TPA: hypothetical protein VN598_15495 [Usitatibacter sp.]|nr:hypothetical protein [Usitatibacter sp.]
MKRFAGALGLFIAAAANWASAQDAASLHAHYLAIRPELADNPFERPVSIQSTETGDSLKGDVYAVVAHPYSVVGAALQGMDHWCDILMLHLNVKDCEPRGSGADSRLILAVGRRSNQPVQDAYHLDFAYRLAASTPGYLEVLLDANSGPLGTSDYRIVLEAVPIDSSSSFVHMSYSYAYGLAARLAMQGYLATIGRDKVGFSVVGRNTDGTPAFIGDVRGVVERNTMRYFLAIDAYVGAFSLPPDAQPEKRLHDWFAAAELYPRQLHEVERDEYLSLKRAQFAQRASRPASAN